MKPACLEACVRPARAFSHPTHREVAQHERREIGDMKRTLGPLAIRLQHEDSLMDWGGLDGGSPGKGSPAVLMSPSLPSVSGSGLPVNPSSHTKSLNYPLLKPGRNRLLWATSNRVQFPRDPGGLIRAL
jgi:hypothetical protein